MTVQIGSGKGPYVADLFRAARDSADFRRVLATTEHTQLVVMTLPPGGEIGEEVHLGIDQTLLVVDGSGRAVLDGEPTPIGPGHVVVVPAGTRHNIVADDPLPMHLVTVYGPPDHAPDTVHHTKAEAEADTHDIPPGGS
jgi:mannose-6-phosphate isomerase-like protein (cupin superfamily)